MPGPTVRLYRDRLKQFLPYTGEGRQRKYTDETVALLREAVELVRLQGLTLEEVANRWQATKAITATEGMEAAAGQHDSTAPSEALSTLAGLFETLGQEQVAGRQTMAAGFAQVSEAIREAGWGAVEALEQRRRADGLQAENDALRAQVAALEADLDRERRRSWWRRLFGGGGDDRRRER